MTDGFDIVDPDDVETERFPESGIRHRKLTEPLGCAEMRVNALTLDPGQATAPHAHERQEEVYVALDGGYVLIDGTRREVAPGGVVRVDGTTHEVPAGGVVRIGPEPVRSIRNESAERTQTWLLFGAPPVGTVDDFGEYRMPEE